MFEIRGTTTHNTNKVIYVAEALGLEYEYRALDLAKREHKSEEHLQRHPFGRLPTLTHDGKHLFESGAICRYLATVSASELYPPRDDYARAQVDQWMDFFTAHLGRWLATLWFEKFLRSRIGQGEANPDNVREALGYAQDQLGVLDKHLAGQPFLIGERFTIADAFAFAYVETTELSKVSLAEYPNVAAWYERGKTAEPIVRAKKRLSA